MATNSQVTAASGIYIKHTKESLPGSDHMDDRSSLRKLPKTTTNITIKKRRILPLLPTIRIIPPGLSQMANRVQARRRSTTLRRWLRTLLGREGENGKRGQSGYQRSFIVMTGSFFAGCGIWNWHKSEIVRAYSYSWSQMTCFSRIP